MASRQTATVATSCSIWPHEILAFTTSAFPSFYSSYILAHFHFFTVQSHATQLTALWADAVMWVTLPVILVFYGGGGGRVRCFCVGVCEGSCFNPFWEVGGPRLFSQKVSNIPRPIPPPSKKGTFPKRAYSWCHPGRIPYSETVSIVLDVAEGLAYLHQQNLPIVHWDLASKNILLTKEKQEKIADVGLAKVPPKGDQNYCSPVPGTPVYAAPDTFHLDYDPNFPISRGRRGLNMTPSLTSFHLESLWWKL